MATDKPGFDSQEKQPLHKVPGKIDAGKSNDGSELTILKPSSEMHDTRPTPGNEAPGQVTKM